MRLHHQVLCVGLILDLVNLILMIPDGFGPASETYARQLFQRQMQKMGKGDVKELPLDPLIIGNVETSPLNIGGTVKDPRAVFGSPITDSAASATAYSCGIKTYNGGVAVDGNGKPCGTILEAAKMKGMRTGMVVTSRVSNATPGSFWGHALHRNMESLISEYLVGMHGIKKMNDVLIGGGLCTFLPGGSVSISSLGKINPLFFAESCRSDTHDLIDFAMHHHDAQLLTNFSELNSLNISIRRPLLGLLSSDHMSFEIDRELTNEPSLAEMTQTALKHLSPINADESENGFVLIVEGSKIDMAAHINDATAYYHEIMAFQDAVKVSISFANSNPNTLVLVIADHETGGLSIGHQVNKNIFPDYVWYPDEILQAKRSLPFLAEATSYFVSQQKKALFSHSKYYNDTNMKIGDEEDDDIGYSNIRAFLLNSILRDGLGLSLNDSRLEDGSLVSMLFENVSNERRFCKILSEFVSKNAQISWSTHGHTGVDVNLYAYGFASSLLKGFHTNNEIGVFLSNLLDVDLDAVTRSIYQSPVVEEHFKRSSSISKKDDIFSHVY